MKFKITMDQLLKDKGMNIRQCLKCGIEDNGTEDHKGFFHRAHIKGRGSNPHLKNDKKNIEILCGLCHIEQTNHKWDFCIECKKPADPRLGVAERIKGTNDFIHHKCMEAY